MLWELLHYDVACMTKNRRSLHSEFLLNFDRFKMKVNIISNYPLFGKTQLVTRLTISVRKVFSGTDKHDPALRPFC